MPTPDDLRTEIVHKIAWHHAGSATVAQMWAGCYQEWMFDALAAMEREPDLTRLVERLPHRSPRGNPRYKLTRRGWAVAYGAALPPELLARRCA